MKAESAREKPVSALSGEEDVDELVQYLPKVPADYGSSANASNWRRNRKSPQTAHHSKSAVSDLEPEPVVKAKIYGSKLFRTDVEFEQESSNRDKPKGYEHKRLGSLCHHRSRHRRSPTSSNEGSDPDSSSSNESDPEEYDRSKALKIKELEVLLGLQLLSHPRNQ